MAKFGENKYRGTDLSDYYEELYDEEYEIQEMQREEYEELCNEEDNL